MKIFVDTALLNEIQRAYSWGIVDGVTTNPSLIKKAVSSQEGLEIEPYIEKICRAVDGPVSLEVIGFTADEMVREGKLLYEKFNPINDNVVVKIPVNTRHGNSDNDYEGLKAIKRLADRNIPTNTTLIMKPEQALLAAKAGTNYVSPFAGRVDDYIRSNIGLDRGKDYQKNEYHDFLWLQEGNYLSLEPEYEKVKGEEIKDIYSNETLRDKRNRIEDGGLTSGAELVRRIRTIFDNYGYSTEVLAASIRNSRQVREVAEAGADIATIPFKVISEMINHPKTEEGIENFTRDVVKKYRDLLSK